MARTSTKTTTSSDLGVQDQIGYSAGQIYNYLSNNGEVSFSKIKKELDLSSNFADLGLGWLAREDKVEISKKGASVNVKLK
ncbi:MAG: winged helix-turn-helix domain-containing protein [Heliobacteriaceae bacterium]|nr:winged helix-turn-helix domain-containing protein [Heliobacteriaceae bacterium]